MRLLVYKYIILWPIGNFCGKGGWIRDLDIVHFKKFEYKYEEFFLLFYMSIVDR